MNLPVYQKAWDFNGLNTRLAFTTSLNDIMGQYLYTIKNYAVGVRGGTVQWTCDGTTGPTNSSDHTDRWASKANAITRATIAAAAQSWVVFNFAGVQILLTYQGASDDIARVSFSPGSNFVLAGTTTNQPTASDECVLLAATSLINSTASADRVLSIQASTDNTVLRWALHRAGSQISVIGIEQLQIAPGVSFTPVLGWSVGANLYGNLVASGGIGGPSAAANGLGSTIMRVAGTNIQPCGGMVAWNANLTANSWNTVFAANPEVNGGASIFPAFVGSATSGSTGWIGIRWDCYIPYSNIGNTATGVVYDDLAQGTRLMLIGAAGAWPWDPTKGLVMA